MYSLSELGTTEWIIIFFLIAIAFIPLIFFLLTLQKTLNVISVENRKMAPSNVWLMLIPLFNIIWQFIMVSKIADSITWECMKLNIPVKETKPTYSSGLTWNILSVCSFIPIVPLVSLVFWIVYWTKVNQYKKLIINNKDNFMLDAEKQIFYTPTS